MSKIITISREFGSGGRELGKRLADELGVPCYDHEIINMVAEQQGFNPQYVANISEKEVRVFYPTTIGNRFSLGHFAANQSMKVVLAENEIIKKLAQKEDCVIVGRCADLLLQNMNPFNIFVYADVVSKLERCSKRASKVEEFSPEEMQEKIRNIDKERANYRGLFTENTWGQKEYYHLCINTSGKDVKMLVPAIAMYSKLWFGEK